MIQEPINFNNFSISHLTKLTEDQKLDIIKFNVKLEDRNELLKELIKIKHKQIQEDSEELKSNLNQLSDIKPVIDEILKELIQ